MTGKEQDELGRLQGAPDDELMAYVKGLLEAEYQYGYDEGWDNGISYEKGIV